MHRMQLNTLSLWSLLAALAVSMAVTTATAATAASEGKRHYSDQDLATMPAPGPNPYLSFLPDGAEVDWNYWRQKMAFEVRRRAETEKAEQQLRPTKGDITIPEVEPNDGLGSPQVIAQFGTGAGEDHELVVAGSFSEVAPATPFAAGIEDEGSITLATPTGGVSGENKTTAGTIGDGLHGSSGSGTGDFDFYSVTNVQAGDLLSMSVATPSPTGSDLDPNCAIWSSTGDGLGFKEDLSSSNFDCAVYTVAPADGTYYFSVGGWKKAAENAVVPADPFDSGSGTGAGSEGGYEVTIGVNAQDIDCFAVSLEPGDSFVTSGSGGVAGSVLVNTTGEVNMSISRNLTWIFPKSSPLRVTGDVATDFVAYESGFHGVCVLGITGPYSFSLGAYRSLLEGTQNRQILFVDFDGAVFDRAIFDATPGPVNLSPLSNFLGGWGLEASDEDAVIDSILAFLNRSISQDLGQEGNPSFDVEIRNSRDHADPFGQPNVSRLIVGGTREELGLDLLGRAQSIDPGNFATEETGVTLLDVLSAPASEPNSLNQYGLAGGFDIIDLIGIGVGSITAHEAGHILGNWHTEQFDPASPPCITDQGGNLINNIGIGGDETLGTADDVEVRFLTDFLVGNEGFSGIEHTGPRTAFALTGPGTDIFADGFESGEVNAWSSTSP